MNAPQGFLGPFLDLTGSTPSLGLKLDKSPAVIKWFEEQLTSMYGSRSAHADGAASEPFLSRHRVHDPKINIFSFSVAIRVAMFALALYSSEIVFVAQLCCRAEHRMIPGRHDAFVPRLISLILFALPSNVVDNLRVLGFDERVSVVRENCFAWVRLRQCLSLLARNRVFVTSEFSVFLSRGVCGCSEMFGSSFCVADGGVRCSATSVVLPTLKSVSCDR
jgi:hypothetical protein